MDWWPVLSLQRGSGLELQEVFQPNGREILCDPSSIFMVLESLCVFAQTQKEENKTSRLQLQSLENFDELWNILEAKIDVSAQGQFKNGDKSGKGKFTWNTGGSYEVTQLLITDQ